MQTHLTFVTLLKMKIILKCACSRESKNTTVFTDSFSLQCTHKRTHNKYTHSLAPTFSSLSQVLIRVERESILMTASALNSYCIYTQNTDVVMHSTHLK